MKRLILSVFLSTTSFSAYAQMEFIPTDTVSSQPNSIIQTAPNISIFINPEPDFSPEQGVCDPDILKIYKGAKCWHGTIYSDKLIVQESKIVLNGKIIGDYNPKIFNLLLGYDGNDLIEGGTGQDIIQGGIGINTLYGKDHNDTLIGSDNVDYMHGGSGEDILLGRDGDDWLYDGPGCDLVSGGDGDDHFFEDYTDPKKSKCEFNQWLDFSWGLGANGDSNGS